MDPRFNSLVDERGGGLSLSERRPSCVDEILDNVGDLMSVLHTVVDMNSEVMIRAYRLAEQLGIDSSTTSDSVDKQTEEIHRWLYQWEDENTVTSHLRATKPPKGDDV